MSATNHRIRSRGWKGPVFFVLLGAAAVVLVLALLRGVFGLSFGFFRTTLNLKPTTLKLEDIRDLEFLVTAEYFGEVIGTARDYLSRRVLPRAEDLAIRLAASPDPAAEKFSAEEMGLLAPVKLAILRRRGMNPRVIDRITDPARVAEYLRPEIVGGRFRGDFRGLVLDRMLEKRDIAYLARGSVQAGYDLKGLTDDSYFYCPSTRTLFLDSRVQVLSRQINPWFVYDPASNLKVKGFEIISQTNVDLEDEDVFEFIKSIKDECQRRLGEDAERAGIGRQARESAERTLEGMLRMLKSDVRTVRILSDADYERERSACPDSGRAVLSAGPQKDKSD